MKILIHVGKDESRETYEFDRGKLLNVEYGAMERVTGMIGDELEDALNHGGMNALTSLIWVLRKRQNPRLRLDEVVFHIDEVAVEIVNDDGTPLTDDADDSADTATEGAGESEDAAAPKAKPRKGKA